MATERAINPIAVIVHLVAIAAGVYLGITTIAAISPDLPSESSQPGVQAPAETGQVAPDDPNSLLQPGSLAIALNSVDNQLGAGKSLSRVHITPSEITSEATDSGGFDVADVDNSAPLRLANLISQQREDVHGLGDFQFVDLRLGPNGEPQWYVQLSIGVDPPRTYIAPLDALSVVPGG
jgi:hypothetical protein